MEINYNGGTIIDPNIAAIIDDLRPNNPTARAWISTPVLLGAPYLRRQTIRLIDKNLDLSGALFEGRHGIKLCDLQVKTTGPFASVTMTFDLVPDDETSTGAMVADQRAYIKEFGTQS